MSGKLTVKNQGNAQITLERQMAKRLALQLRRDEWAPIADSIISRMLQLIARGISPISERGRFPGYKWATKVTNLKTASRELRRLARGFGRGEAKKKATRAAKKKLDDVNAIRRNKYPFNQTDEFPNKKVRPVNLFLSGDFLSNLKWRFTDKTRVSIGFFDELSQKKEQGHRVGVNSQPKRPIIPEGREKLNPVIDREWKRALDRVLRRKLKSNRT